MPPRFASHIQLLLFCVASVAAGPACHAQEVKPWSGFTIEANGIAGKVYKHETKFTLPIPALTTGIDVSLLQHTYGRKDWHQLRRYPTIGLGFTYINYGIDSIYGHCFGIYPCITVPLISGTRLRWTLRAGDGIGYVTKTFHRTAPVDTINVAIGSHINDFFMLMTDLRYRINSHWDLQLGANITHISDASYHKPNLGINMIGAHMGVSYSPVTSQPAHLLRNFAPPANRWLFQARLSMSLISSNTPGGPLFPVYITSGYVSRRWLGKNKVFGGIDFSYYENIYAYLVNNELSVGTERQNSYKSALFAGNEFLIGRVGVVVQAGLYLHQAYIRQDAVYEKIGGNYYFVQKEHGPIKEFFLSAFVKTDLTVAEFGELGFGVGF